MNDFVERVLANRHDRRPPNLKSFEKFLAESPDIRSIAVVIAHADDAEISLGGTITWLVRNGYDVTVVLLFSGHRCPGLMKQGLRPPQITQIRVDEAENACRVTGASLRFLDLSAYERPDYLPSDEDIESVGDAFNAINPQLVFVHQLWDHRAHAAAREITALGYYQSRVRQATFFTLESPWSALGGGTPPTHYFPLRSEMEIKLKAIRQFRSQLLATDYTAVVDHNAQMWKAKAFECIHGNHAEPVDADFADAHGLEVMRLEQFDPHLAEEPWFDPVHMTLAELQERQPQLTESPLGARV